MDARCTCTLQGSPVPCPMHGMFNRLPRYETERTTAMTPTQPPAPTGATARDVMLEPLCEFDDLLDPDTVVGLQLTALAEAGYVIVERDNLEMAVEWMDQTENPWSGSETFAETWTAALVAQYELKDVIHEFYAARQPEGVRE